ncbi:MAG: hypothetical protein Q4D16_22360, partial [Eubacteriales bacterium]|nr:hypothetical protein [Eubacteriales bacterium]
HVRFLEGKAVVIPPTHSISELPGSIFLEGLKIMEDILENDTIAIYTLDSWQRFGRLAVCSNSQLQKLTKSIKIEDYQTVYDQLNKGEVWKNTELTEGLPMYACGVFRDGVMVLMITIQEVSLEQYGMHYMNIFRILCGLVQTSFLRAVEYEKLREEQLYFHGTNVVYPERLRQLVEIQEAMQDSGNADYVLVKFQDKNKEKISSLLKGIIRASDTIGADESGCVYLLLAQTSRENFHIVGKRIDSCGLKYEIVGKVGSS